MMRSLLVLVAVVAALFFICVQCAPKEFSLYKQEPDRSPIRILETIGGGHTLGRTALNRIEGGRTLYTSKNGQVTGKLIYPEKINWDILLARGLDSIGGSNLLGRDAMPGDIGSGYRLRSLDSIGGSNLLGRDAMPGDIGSGYRLRSLDSIGGSNLLGRDAMPGDIGSGYQLRSLDSIGGSNLLGRDAMPGDIGSGYRLRSLDSIGGSNLLGRELDDIGGGNLIGRDAMPCDIGC
ncbi:uncharacterized protein LOC130445984 [Diorhabda sublineata]|uniref:uncharacterized protein LOC130445984 n=1 Tax=Diorhabda sublineata TaxID=1163346 RepID=UPI0024E16E4B|nr:uncharacterized protein LOC130445984 [Diorhabda sublineata]